MRRRASAAWLALAAWGICCGRSPETSRQSPGGSSVWIVAGSAVERDTARRVEAAGFGEWVVEAGPPSALPSRSVVQLAALVDAPAGSASSDAWTAWAEAFAADLGRRRLEAEARGWVVSAAHLELARTPSSAETEALAEVADSLRRRHGYPAVALGLPGAALAAETDGDLARLCRSFDRVMATIHGQRPEEPDDPAAYDVGASMRRADRLAALGRPFQARVETLGAVLGRPAATRLSLAALARHPRLRLDNGFSLTGIDRSVYRFVATGEATLATGLRLRPREAAEIRLPLASVLRDLRDRLEARAEPRFRGLSWRRLPLPGEGLALGVTALESVAAGRAPALGLRATLEWVEGASPPLLRAVLENQSDLGSDVSFLDSNFVELGASGALFGAVALGDFQRYDFLRHGEERVTVAAMRRPERIRLFLSALGAGETVRSGPIEWAADGAPPARFTIEARFIVPGGGEARSARVESAAPVATRR